uniref:Uncharacterized protein n=1 Tax=Arion vulgaris TaxID=1028688 RepID=A0A0B7BF87_9EUPU
MNYNLQDEELADFLAALCVRHIKNYKTLIDYLCTNHMNYNLQHKELTDVSGIEDITLLQPQT